MIHQWNLNLDWRFHRGAVDLPGPKSHSDAYDWAHAGSRGGVAGVNFDDSDWEVVNLPHDYMVYAHFSEDEVRNHGYRKPYDAWYRKRFLLPEEYRNKHILLTFEGIAMTARVYLNGSLVGRAFSCYVPLEIDITDRAFFGERINTLVVEVDGYSLEGWYYEGNGIYRDVTIKVKEPLHIKENGCFIKPVKAENSWQVECSVDAENTTYYNTDTYGDVFAKVEILDGDSVIASGITDSVRCPHDASATMHCCFGVDDPQLWDVDNPKLYCAKVSLCQEDTLLDVQTYNIGFRTFVADPNRGFLLNGKPFKMKGTCNHMDHAGIGLALPDAICEYRIKLLKDLGTNTYRNAHNMAMPMLLNACDRQGMLLINENRLFESSPEVLEQARQMVRYARNHPCVIMYSMFNEEAMQATREGTNIFRRLKNAVKELDDTRLVTAAMGGGTFDPNGTSPLMDITGVNYSIPYAPEGVHKMFPNQPVFGTENCSVVATRGCYKTDAEKCLCACYDEDVVDWGQNLRYTLDFSRKNDWYGGVNIWTGFDYRGEPSPYSWPAVSSYFGLYDTCGFPKDTAYLVKSFFKDEPIVHLLPHWNHNEGDVVRVMTYSNCDEIELFLNSKSLGRKVYDPIHPAEWNISFVPGQLRAVGYKDGQIVAEDVQETAGKPCKIVMEPQRPSIQNNGRDAVCVNFHTVDENGILVPTADNVIHFEVGGDGIYMGAGNGDPNSHECDSDPFRRLFAGRAQAVVGAKPNAKSVTIRAYGEGLEEASFTFDVVPGVMPDYLASQQHCAVHGATVSLKTYEERPDINVKFSDFDMNSMENIVFDTYSYKPIYTDGWKLFRVTVRAPKLLTGSQFRVVFQSVAASHIAVSVNEETYLDQPHSVGPVAVTFPCAPATEYDVRLLAKGTGKESGILGGVSTEVLH